MSARTQAARAALSQTAYHSDQHHAWRRIALVLALVSGAEAAVLAGYVHYHSTVYITVAATPDGRVIEMTPLDEPIMSDAALRTWTVSAVTEAFTLGHHDWRMRLADIREYFTGTGYDGYLQGPRRQPLPRPHPREPAGRRRGPHRRARHHRHAALRRPAAWSIEFPVLVTFQAGARVSNQRLLARVLVMRVPLSENARGIGIQQLIATRIGA